jgi:two-component system, sensor histidine kinase and response regulator
MSHDENAAGVFDRDKALECFDGDMGLLLEIAQMYLTDGPGRLQEIREGLKRRDAPAMERAAHRMRGSLGALGASLAADAAQTLETHAAKNDFPKIEDAVAALDREIARLRPALENLIKGEGVKGLGAAP